VSRSGCSLPPGKTRYPLHRRMSGPQGRSGQVRKISPPPVFDPRTVQPVGSRYTDYATRPTFVFPDYRKSEGTCDISENALPDANDCAQCRDTPVVT